MGNVGLSTIQTMNKSKHDMIYTNQQVSPQSMVGSKHSKHQKSMHNFMMSNQQPKPNKKIDHSIDSAKILNQNNSSYLQKSFHNYSGNNSKVNTSEEISIKGIKTNPNNSMANLQMNALIPKKVKQSQN